jgi:hypothetical protein
VTLPPVVATAVGLPVPLVGPVDVPIVPVTALIVLGLGAVGRRRRS